MVGVGFECNRARVYQNRVDDYRTSDAVVSLRQDIDQLAQYSSGDVPMAVFCRLSMSEIAYFVTGVSDRIPVRNEEKFLTEIHAGVEAVSPAPSFNSMLQILPRIREARIASEELHEGLVDIKNLTTQDTRSEYCFNLYEILAQLYFVDILRTEQGVSALHVGQIENFRLDVNDAQEKLQALAPPKPYANQHRALNDFLNDLRSDLQASTNQYTTFSRTIESDYLTLESILAEIEAGATDLAERPEQLLIRSKVLQK